MFKELTKPKLNFHLVKLISGCHPLTRIESTVKKKKKTQKTLSFHISLVSKKDKKADGIKMELEPKMVSLDLIQQTYGNHYIKKGICALRS